MSTVSSLLSRAASAVFPMSLALASLNAVVAQNATVSPTLLATSAVLGTVGATPEVSTVLATRLAPAIIGSLWSGRAIAIGLSALRAAAAEDVRETTSSTADCQSERSGVRYCCSFFFTKTLLYGQTVM